MAQQQGAPEETALWQRRLASQANNRAWRLSESTGRSPAETQEMLHAAHSAMHLWSIVGNEGNKAHASLLLAHVYALLGQKDPAAAYHAASSAYFFTGDREAWEIALVHAVAANVASCSQDAAAHRRSYLKAQELIGALPDPEDREILQASFLVVPVPPST